MIYPGKSSNWKRIQGLVVMYNFLQFYHIIILITIIIVVKIKVIIITIITIIRIRIRMSLLR